MLRGNQDENSLLTQIVALHGVYLQAPTADLLATIGRDGKVPPRFCAEYGHEVVETLVEKKTGKGLDAAATWSAGLTAFSASGLSSADSD